MNKKISLLAAFLGLQLVIAIAIFIVGNQSSSNFISETLIRFDSAQIDKIVISEADTEISLLQDDKQWRLASNGLLIAQEKLTGLLDKLAGLKTTWPVASTPSSHERFEVAENQYRRKITLLSDGNTVAELYLGTSPGFKKSHVRMANADEVYALALNSYDLSIAENDWLDTSLLAVDLVMRITAEGYTLVKQSDQWQLQPSQEERQVLQDKVAQLAKAIANFNVQSVIAEPPEFAPDKTMVIEVEASNGASYVFELLADNEQYYIRRTGIEAVFSLNKYEYDRLSVLSIDALTRVNPAQTDP